MGRKEYKRYSREFKLEAVRLAAVSERPKAQLRRENAKPREENEILKKAAIYFARESP